MQDRPSLGELLDAIAELLDDEILPQLDGGSRHKVRVAANLCRIMGREVELGAALDARERELLVDLLDHDGGESTAELSAMLAERLHRGDDTLARAAHGALVEIVRGKLAVAKPGHDAFDFGTELDTDPAS